MPSQRFCALSIIIIPPTHLFIHSLPFHSVVAAPQELKSLTGIESPDTRESNQVINGQNISCGCSLQVLMVLPYFGAIGAAIADVRLLSR